MKRIIIALILAAGVAMADMELGPQRKNANRQAVRQLKQSAAWIGMTNQLAQYDGHYTAATNNAAQITDAKTRNAVTQAIRATDDCRDALAKLIRCFVDNVEAQGK